MVSPDVRRPFVGAEPVQSADVGTSRQGDSRVGVVQGFRGVVQRSKRVLKKLACGGIAGAVSRTATAPVETVKTVLMVSGDKYPNVGPLGTGLRIIKNDGWRGLFRGNGVNVLRVAPSKAIELFAFDTMRKMLVDEDGASKLPLPLPPASVAGACAGLSSTVVCYPMEVVKTRLTVEVGKYSGIGNCFVTVASEEGITALYRGLLASAMGIIPYAATNYYTYDGLRRLYRRLKRKRLTRSGVTPANANYIGTLPTLAIGSVSGAIAATVTFPLEVVRRQLQAGRLMNGEMYNSISDCALGIMRKQGVRGFYRGLGPSCIKLMPAAGMPRNNSHAHTHVHHLSPSSEVCRSTAVSRRCGGHGAIAHVALTLTCSRVSCALLPLSRFTLTGISFATYETMKVLLHTEQTAEESSSSQSDRAK